MNYTLKPIKVLVIENGLPDTVVLTTEWRPSGLFEALELDFLSASIAVNGNAARVRIQRRGMSDRHLMLVRWDSRNLQLQNLSQPVIVCAAVRSTKSETIHASPRHFDTIGAASIRNSTNPLDLDQEVEWEEGFLDQFGTFYSRQAAWIVAVNASQVVRRCGGDEADGGTLYSENLY